MSPTDYSRLMRLAAAADSEASNLRDQLEGSRVHLSVDRTVPGAETALRILAADMRRLPVQLSVDPGHGRERLSDELIDHVERTAQGIDPERRVAIGDRPPDAMHVRIGIDHAAAHISGAPDGHGTHLRRAGIAFPPIAHAGTGLGAVLTAAMLAAEVFKTVTALRPGTHRQIESLSFCPVTPFGLPSQPEHLEVERLALIGSGAIGTAVALILAELDATGDLIVVDRQAFEPPNIISYSLGTTDDAVRELPKVDIVKATLRSMSVTPIHGTIDDLIAGIDAASVIMPRIVLGAVDNIPARHDMQRIYSDLILDGGTGGKAGTTISLHEALPTGPCLQCYFPVDRSVASVEQRLHELTGLPLSRIAQGDRPVTPEDLHASNDRGRELLRPHLGRPICGLSQLLGLTTVDDDSYQPSAAFVAQQAASLIVGALIARSQPGIHIPTRQLEYDALYGPTPDMIDDRRPRPGCYCQSQAGLIAAVRHHRANGSAPGRS